MNDLRRYPRPFICLVRHGETELSASRRYNGLTDVALTQRGEEEGLRLAPLLSDIEWEAVLCSPLQRARRTATLAGFPDPRIVDELRELDYGDYEAKTTEEIYEERLGWDFWRDGCPSGDSPATAAERLDVVVEHLHSYRGCVLLFSHSHSIRILTARWLGLEPERGSFFEYAPAHLSLVGTHRGRPVIKLWNDGSHLTG